MKSYFAEYHFIIRKVAKALGQTCELLVRAADLLQQLPSTGEKTVVANMRALFFKLEWRVLLGHGTHYFVETEKLASVLVERSPKLTPELCVHFAEMLMGDGTQFGVIHTTGSAAHAFLFAVSNGQIFIGRNARIVWVSETGKAAMWVPFTTLMEKDDRVIVGSPDDFGDLKLLVSTCIYIHSFPHALVNGFPESAKHPAHYKGEKCVQVTEVEEIKAPKTRDGNVQGHYRGWHWRMLKAERYTNKRFEAVFVNGCDVNGGLKTIVEVPELGNA